MLYCFLNFRLSKSANSGEGFGENPFFARKGFPAECLRCRLRSRAVKRAYFTLISTAMHAHPMRRRTAPVFYVRRHAPYGALYGYCIKTFQFLFLSSFSAPNIYILFRVDKLMDNVSERNGVSDNANRVRQLAGGGVPPLSITFSRGKTRLLYINLHCYARTSGAAAHGAGFLRPPTRPLWCALRLLYQNFSISFSIKFFRT